MSDRSDILPLLLSFPGSGNKKLSPKEYDTQISAYLKDISKLKDVSLTKRSLLELLDPAVNSVAYMFAFNRQVAALSAENKSIEPLAHYAIEFLHQFDPIQVRYAGQEWRTLWTTVWHVLDRTRSNDLSPLVTGLLRLDPSSSTFTSNHVRLLRLALQNGVPSQALPILDKNIQAYPQKASKRLPEELPSEEHEFSNAFITGASGFSLDLKSEYVLEYYLLGASIYLAMNNHLRARLFLEHVLLSPSHTKSGGFSALQAEACMKWLMLGLLVEGQQFPLPKTMDATIVKNIRSMCPAYEALALDFEKRDAKKFEADLEAGETLWADEGNLRLVKDVALALQRYKVIDLQKTYAALPISRVTELLELPADLTAGLLQDMIETGSLLASLSQTESGEDIITFHSSEAKLPEPVGGTADLEDRTQRITDLIQSVKEADRRLQLTKELVEHTKRSKKAGNGVDGDLADVMDLEYDNPISALPPMQSMNGGGNGEDDEDLMQG